MWLICLYVLFIYLKIVWKNSFRSICYIFSFVIFNKLKVKKKTNIYSIHPHPHTKFHKIFKIATKSNRQYSFNSCFAIYIMHNYCSVAMAMHLLNE